MTDAMRERTTPTGSGAHRARLLADTGGNVLPLTAAIVLVLCAVVGGGVDMARAYKAERRLQAACDAGVLAGRRAVTTNGFDTAAQIQATAYFNANYDVEGQGTDDTLFTPTSTDEGNTINGSATAKLPTLIMRVFGYESLDLGVVCTASMGIGNADVMFVLDNTGSMADKPDGTRAYSFEDSKMYALREAMKDFYETVAATNVNSNARIRYGFVPYSTSVRVGRLIRNLNPDYLANSVTVPSIAFYNWNATPASSWSQAGFTYTNPSNVTNWANISVRYSTNARCTENKPADTAWSDYGSDYDSTSYRVEADTDGSLVQIKTMGVHQPQRRKIYQCNNRYVQERTEGREKRSYSYEKRRPIAVTTANSGFATAVLQDRTLSVSTYKNFTSVSLPTGINKSYSPYRTSNVSSTWQGCIMERQTVPAASFSFASLARGITPSEALDLNIDAAPTSDESTKWRPLWNQSSKVLWFRDNEVPYESLDDDGNGSLSDAEIGDNDAAAACPVEAKLFAELDEDDFGDYVESLQSTGNTYHDSGLIWGARLSSPTGLWSTLVNQEPANGGVVSRHMIFMTDGELVTNLTSATLYGIEMHERRVTSPGDDSGVQYERHRSRYLAVCEAIKARGIRLWVIAFGDGVTLSTDLTTCASPDSAFKSDDAADLSTTFQEIAKQVGELRITQ